MKRNFLLGFLTLMLMWAPGFPQDDDDCLSCHEDQDLSGINLRNKEVSMFVAADAISESIHDGMSCIDCHTDLDGFDDYPHDEELAPVACANCHDEAAEIYTVHGRLEVGTDPDIPSCGDCHGHHDILPADEEASAVNPARLPHTCGVCHADIDLTSKHEIRVDGALMMFEASVHGKALESGEMAVATCKECHSRGHNAHEILPMSDHQSTINHFNIPKTCGKCHATEEQEFWKGIHGKLVARGDTESPVCTHCHGEHGIMSPSDPRSPVNPLRIAEATCTPCHESAYLNERYKLGDGSEISWYDSYHGVKSQSGDVTVANCASCHMAHLILPSSDSASSVHPNNLQTTCGHCHPTISAAMAATPIHQEPGADDSKIPGIVKKLYIWMIIIVIGGMVVHGLIDFLKQVRMSKKMQQVQRMNTNEVLQHYLLMITFTVLVFTGFSLRFSDAWWVTPIFGYEGGFELRGLIHRVTAVLFIVSSVWHGLYMLTARGRQFVKDMFPTMGDAKDALHLVGFNLGLRAERPALPRFTYAEKAEYWALVWGTIVMVLTGLFLWFENELVQWFPMWFMDTFLIIHYYEAWLATLAIIVWHFYSVIFSPGVYPMNRSWIDGKMLRSVYQHEHGGDKGLQEGDYDIPEEPKE